MFQLEKKRMQLQLSCAFSLALIHASPPSREQEKKQTKSEHMVWPVHLVLLHVPNNAP